MAKHEDQIHSIRTPAQAWFQPLGWWRERGASDAALRLATSLDPGPLVAATFDKAGYSLWHYWAEGAHAEKRIDSLSEHPELATPTYREARADDGEHPWHRLMLRGQLGAAKAWLDNFGCPELTLVNGQGDDMLLAACWSGDATLVRWLLAMGAEPHGVDRQGLNALMVAIHRCPLDLVHDLIQAGADPEAVDKQRKNALHHVANAGLAELFPLLEDAGADSEAKDSTGNTANEIMARSLKSSLTSMDTSRSHWARRYQARLSF